MVVGWFNGPESVPHPPSQNFVAAPLVSIDSKTVIPVTFKGISGNHDRLHPQLARTGGVLSITRLNTTEMEIKKKVASHCCS